MARRGKLLLSGERSAASVSVRLRQCDAGGVGAAGAGEFGAAGVAAPGGNSSPWGPKNRGPGPCQGPCMRPCIWFMPIIGP